MPPAEALTVSFHQRVEDPEEADMINPVPIAVYSDYI